MSVESNMFRMGAPFFGMVIWADFFGTWLFGENDGCKSGDKRGG